MPELPSASPSHAPQTRADSGHERPETSLDINALTAVLPDLYIYARWIIGRYHWKAGLCPGFQDVVHDAIEDALRNLTGGKVARVWDLTRIDLPTFVRGQVRSRINMYANSAASRTTTEVEDLTALQDELFKGTYLDELITMRHLQIDLLNVFKMKPAVLPVLQIIIRDVHYSPGAIARELQWDQSLVQKAWSKIAVVARQMLD